MTETPLRPLERVILRMRDDGRSLPAIGLRVDRRPGTVGRILEMIEHKAGIPGRAATPVTQLRPVERVVLRLRDEGESYGQIGNRLRMSGAHVRRIEAYSQLRNDT